MKGILRNSLEQKAQQILEGNWTGSYTVPSRAQYPHQWLWDSAFHAIVLSRYNEKRAKRELTTLLDSSWEDSRIPHIVFNPDTVAQYRPNHLDYATNHFSSGITQPPVIATALLELYRQTEDLEFLATSYSSLVQYHEWIKAFRDPEDTGLVAIVHPWESGTDNSPVYSTARDAFLKNNPEIEIPPRVDHNNVTRSQRPLDDDYRFYWGLIQLFQKVGWDASLMYEMTPFLFVDVLFCSIWSRANRDLSRIAQILEKENDAARFQSWHEHTKKAVAETLWCDEEQFFFPLDLREQRLQRIRTSSGFVPLFGDIPSTEIASKLIEELQSPSRFQTPYGVPSTAMDEASFQAERYWQGPIWINLNWMIARGLAEYGFQQLATGISNASLKLVHRSGFRENYHPLTGEGLGAADFSWSTLAALSEYLE